MSPFRLISLLLPAAPLLWPKKEFIPLKITFLSQMKSAKQEAIMATNSSFRKATSLDMDSVFKMGFETWGGDRSAADYLTQCHSSAKYKKGDWFVLVDETNQPMSSLIVYQFAKNEFGIGSICTQKKFRRQGYASQLISQTLQKFEKENPEPTVFLYSDIDSKFYKKFCFEELPQILQKHSPSICMVRTQQQLHHLTIPDYF